MNAIGKAETCDLGNLRGAGRDDYEVAEASRVKG